VGNVENLIYIAACGAPRASPAVSMIIAQIRCLKVLSQKECAMPKTAKSKVAHTSFEVADFEKSLKFYVPLMELLNFKVSIEDEWAYFTSPDGFIFNISQAARATDRTKNVHLAFNAKNSKKLVDQFYKIGISAGGKSNGKPGVRKDYAPDYYAAFVFDPDHNNIEVAAHHK
jgi:catechol 2,3-dioxygenase-like lactoylglutathione lyase family enzyme